VKQIKCDDGGDSSGDQCNKLQHTELSIACI